jgi:hypothetical protein
MSESQHDHRIKPNFTLSALIEIFDNRFKSANSIPVTRATIHAEEWRTLRQALIAGEKLISPRPTAMLQTRLTDMELPKFACNCNAHNWNGAHAGWCKSVSS